MAELMCPAGSFESLQAAIKAGADSVYFGVGRLNMRSRAIKFSIDDLGEIISICKSSNVKSYLTLNSVMYDEDLEEMKGLCDKAKGLGVTAIIASDMSVIQYAHSIGLEVHMSTQTNISNIEAVKFYARYADVIVLARELSLEQIREICNQIREQNIRGPDGNLIKIEVFVHGALCVSISGKCYMSLATYNRSANRGSCLQNCRRKYIVRDEETGDELKIDNNYVMSPKDLCTIGIMDRLIDAGVEVFKIEGRARGEEYVYTVTKCYKEAIESVLKNTYTEERINNWRNELKKVFNRGFWENGYYLGKKIGEWSASYGSRAAKEKVEIGRVKNFYNEKMVAHIELTSGGLNTGDSIIVTGPATGIVSFKAGRMLKDDKEINKAVKGDSITIKVPEKARQNDRVFVMRDRKSFQ